jgi:hypothetical protein
MSDPNQGFQAPPPPPTIEAEPERPRPTYLMYAGIGLFVLGIILFALIIAVFGVPGIAIHASTAGAICGLGILLFAFSFYSPPGSAKSTAENVNGANVDGNLLRTHERLSQPARPPPVFGSRHHRRIAEWIVRGRLCAPDNALSASLTLPWISSRRARLSRLPKALAKMRTDGAEQQKSVVTQIGNVLRAVTGHFFGVAFLAALFLLGVLAFGGRMHFWQTYAVVAYVTLPFTIIQKGISFLILYLKVAGRHSSFGGPGDPGV